MPIRFIYGPSGSGKSTKIQNIIIDSSLKNPERRHLLIVPDQFNLQTQMRMVRLHPDHAFSNIEVLGFSRLAHRILEEAGGEDIPVLDDTGKSLIIRRIADRVSPELKVMSTKLDRIGYIHEVKSAISEFLQYGISPDDLKGVIDNMTDHRALSLKLHDLMCIYRAFMEDKAGEFITREETLDLVRKRMHRSELVKDSFIAFDGFTGFTPIQEKVIQEMMVLASDVYFVFTTDHGCDIHDKVAPENVFALSHTSCSRLLALAEQASVAEDEAIRAPFDGVEASDRPACLTYLEKRLFRPDDSDPFTGGIPGHIKIYKAADVRSEITDTFQRIRELIRTRGFRYRDIAIVTGDISAYADGIADTAAELDIPVYMDYSRPIMLSPFIEALLAAFEVVRFDYRYESLIRFMRTGFGPLNMHETDELENFLMRTGIRGHEAFGRVWTYREPALGELSEEALNLRIEEMERLNASREKVYDWFASLHNTGETIGSYSGALYDFIDKTGMYDKLLKMSRDFASSNDHIRALEYEQIYALVLKLLDQMAALCGDEKTDTDSYVHMLEAGLSEIRLSVIPADSDRLMVGDIVRTRLSEIKALFLLGANDCYIPGDMSSGGIISDIDREYLRGGDGQDARPVLELAPSPRDQLYIQKLYLYMNLCKPSKELIVSCALSDTQGRELMPSYLIEELCKLFPGLEPHPSSDTHSITVAGDPEKKISAPADHIRMRDHAAMLLRRYMAGGLNDERSGELDMLISLFDSLKESGDEDVLGRMCDMSAMHYEHTPLSHELAVSLYGSVIMTSVSRLEKFAGCAYAHFLSYGLKLRTRPEYSFENTDMGEVYHKSLEEFEIKLTDEGLTWEGLTEADADKWVDEIMDIISTTYGDTILISNSRNMALANRIRRVVKRSVDTIRYQVVKGKFVPKYFEKRFFAEKKIGNSDSEDMTYRISGKIDRMDICDSDNGKYLRIVDYKSGNRDFDLAELYHGLMMQLAVYMSRALGLEEDAKPAGMLYYHISDPVIESDKELSDEEALQEVRKSLKMKGIVNSSPEIIALMDKDLAPGVKSDVIPVNYKKDSSPDSHSKIYDEEELKLILDFAEHRMDTLMEDIMSGDIDASPAYKRKSAVTPCTYCDYASVCHIRAGIPGYEPKVYDKIPESELMEKMRQELGRNEEDV